MTETHEVYEMLMMRVLDDEADGKQRADFEAHRASCVACASEYREFAEQKAVTDQMRSRIVAAADQEPLRSSGPGRAVEVSAYALLLAGTVLVVGWWVWVFMSAPDVPAIVKYGVGLGLSGALLLLTRTVAHRARGADPYEEIDR